MSTNAQFTVGGFVVQPQLNKLVADDRTIRLEPKVMEVLLCLYRHSGEVISRDEIMRQVWSGTFVTPDSLKRCISALRKALRDDAETPKIIETIPKRGYRLAVSGPVAQPAEGFTSVEADIATLGENYPVPLLRWFIAMGSLLGLDEE